MSRYLSRARRRSAAPLAAVAVATVGTAALLAPAPAAHAALTIGLQFPGGATTMLVGGDQTNTSIPIQVWATVTGANATTATAGLTTGDFDGLQYAYYNIVNSNAAGSYINGSISSAVLNSALGFNGNGSQTGVLANVQGGVSVGSTNGSLGSFAKPRAASAVFNNNSSTNASSSITGSGTNTVRFLIETLNYNPSAFTSRAKTTFSVSIPTAAQLNSSGGFVSQANWFQDTTNQSNTSMNGQPTPVSSNLDSTAVAGTQVVIQDTIAGDANLDGSVTFADLGIVLAHYGATDTKFADGNFNYTVNGDTKVDFSDLGVVLAAYGSSLGTITPSVMDASPALTADPQAVAALAADGISVVAVPEPTSMTVMAIGASLALTVRRRRHA